MTKFPIPNSPAKKVLDIDNFNGVDFTSKVPDISRSNYCENVIKRDGFHQIRKTIKHYKSSREHTDSILLEKGNIIGANEILFFPTSNPKEYTNEEFKNMYPNFEEGKVVIGNETGAMFIERNNPNQYGLFIVTPNRYGATDMSFMGYQVSKNLLNLASRTTGIKTNGTSTADDFEDLSTDDKIEIIPSVVATFFSHQVVIDNLKPNTDYTLSSSFTGTWQVHIYTDKLYGNSLFSQPLCRSNTFNTGDNTRIILGFYSYNNPINTTYSISNIMLEEGSTPTEYSPYVYDDGYVTVGNKIVSFGSGFAVDQWVLPITIFDEQYLGSVYIQLGFNEERAPKLIDKITGELWEERSDGYYKTSDEYEMYLKISGKTINNFEYSDYFQVFDDAHLLGIKTDEKSFKGYYDRENPIPDTYKKAVFDDKHYYFTATGIYSIEAKAYKSFSGEKSIKMKITKLGTFDAPTKIPLYRINANPELTKYTQNEDINLLDTLVEVGYKGDGTSTRYKLMYNRKEYDIYDEVRVKLLDANGIWAEYGEHDDIFSFDTTGDYIVFVNAPDIPLVDGEDNVKIIQRYGAVKRKAFNIDAYEDFFETSIDNNTAIAYSLDYDKANDEKTYLVVNGKQIFQDDEVANPYPNGKAWYVEPSGNRYIIYKYRENDVCPKQTLVTYDPIYADITEEQFDITCNIKNLIVYGNENERRLFVNKNKNIQVYSDANDITYWPSSNYNVIGDESDICGFGLSNGYLLTFKKGNNSIFVQQGATINNKSVFPIIYSQTSNYVLSEPIQLEDRLYVFTTTGLEEIDYNANLLLFTNRSYFINKKLKNMNFNTLKWFKWDDNLYFMMQGIEDARTHIFVADLDDNSRVYEKSSSVGTSFPTGIGYQYEWYFLRTHIPPLQLTDYKWEDSSGIHFLGYNSEGLYELYDADDEEEKVDTEIFVNELVPLYLTTPIKAYWETPFIDMDDIMKAKTIRGIYLNTKGKLNDKLIIMTKTIDEGYNKIAEITFPDNHKNLFNINNLTLFTGVVDYTTGVIKVNQYSNQSVQTLKQLCPNLKIGETYVVSAITTGTQKYIYLWGSNIVWGLGMSHTITQSDLNSTVLFYGEPNDDITINISNIQIEKGDRATAFEPYKIRQDDFPRRVYVKDKLRKFMNVKYLFTNDEKYNDPSVKATGNFSFNRLSIEYQDAGKYRGE